MKTCLFVILLLCLSGCALRLPKVKAGEVHEHLSILGIVTNDVDATGAKITETTIKVDDVTWLLNIPLLGVTKKTTVKGYEQRREKELP